MQFFQMLKGGRINTNQMVNMMIQQNPQMAQMLKGVDINNPNTMKQACQNYCNANKIDFNTMWAQFQNVMNGKL